MVSRRGFLLPIGCRGSFSWQPRSWNGGGGGTERRTGIADRSQGFPSRRVNIGQRGHREGPQGSQEASWRGLGWGRARDPPGALVGPPPSFFGDSGSFRVAVFYIIFPGFIWHF